ncbi:UvrD-helicase domain-containing protein [candidate division WWE3 bacterium]|uniref:DNA 3'-5' helicase n=1 Tax=candidate division WWE3 bacterium TaxID=2053526 RepID=A0A955LFM0_UNCKA|nr:UvrD-helicase domain-containing protein [candidate division WWE3 bacterium]
MTDVSQITDQLNEEQKNAVTHGDGAALVLAGAGSGKTRVLTHRIAHLILNGVSPDNILAVTFTNKASAEMKERVKKILAETDVHVKTYPTLGTFHSLCARVLKAHIHHLGYTREFIIYDSSDQLSLIKKIFKALDINDKKTNPRGVLNAISSAKNDLISPSLFEQSARGTFHELVAKVYTRYQRELKQNNALDFDDLLVLTVKLLQENESVRTQYQQRYQYVLIDEYQDTNQAQYMIARLMSEPQKNIFVVGDMSQAIYSWRGANIRNILQFKTDYPGATIYNLEQNYRSTQTILDAATAVITPNRKAHPILNLWTENSEGEPITLYEGNDETDEAFYISQKIKELVKDGSDYENMSVLYRTNAQSRALEELFIREGIPYQLIGNVKFYDRREIKDILAYLRLIYNPNDSISFDRVVNTPTRGIGPATIERGGPKLDAFYTLMESFREKAASQSIYDLIDTVLDEIDYEAYLSDGTEEGISRWENVKELRSVAAEYAHLEPIESLGAFLENVALVEQTDMSQSGDTVALSNVLHQGVTLMTLHAAKGLEFPVVFMIGLEEGIFPHSRSMTDPQELEEERRLCYVGITRAREKLFLSFARRRLLFGERLPNPPSRFLGDLPKDTLVHEKSKSFGQFDTSFGRSSSYYGGNIDDEEIIF